MHLDGFSWDYDEGTHVYMAWLVQQGHPLYGQTFSAQAPGFILAVALGTMLRAIRAARLDPAVALRES